MDLNLMIENPLVTLHYLDVNFMLQMGYVCKSILIIIL